jgi:exopolysaccharide biosynthesis polyprenyl glycosylphosphotransferase
MNTFRRQLIVGILKIFYPGLLAESFGLATALMVSGDRNGVTFASFFSMRIKLSNFIIFAVILFCWHVVLSWCGLYESARLKSKTSLTIETAKATVLTTAILKAFAIVFAIKMVNFKLLFLFWAFSSSFLLSSRITIGFLMGKVRILGRNLRNVLIVGTNSRAIVFAQKIQANPQLGYRVIGFADGEWEGLEQFRQGNYKLCCDFEKLFEYLRWNVVDEVAIYLPLRSFHEYTSQIAVFCKQHGIVVRFTVDIFDLKTRHSHTDEIEGESHVTTYAGSPQAWPLVVKRLFDVVASSILLIICAPLFAMVAVIIKLTTKGPVFFRQDRIGFNKRIFVIYKFRTMIPDADRMQPQLALLNEVSGPVFKIRNDPRITSVGAVLRKTSIDELPQLFNVLNGTMSMVGPRPLPVRDYKGFSEDWQRRRFSVRPGITCLWQINGRSAVPFKRWMEMDLEYIDQWSLWLDLRILVRTLPAVLKGSGAA